MHPLEPFLWELPKRENPLKFVCVCVYWLIPHVVARWVRESDYYWWWIKQNCGVVYGIKFLSLISPKFCFPNEICVHHDFFPCNNTHTGVVCILPGIQVSFFKEAFLWQARHNFPVHRLQYFITRKKKFSPAAHESIWTVICSVQQQASTNVMAAYWRVPLVAFDEL